MINHEIAKIFYEMAILLEMKDIPFKPRAYEKAAMTIEGLEEDLKEIVEREERGGIENVPGVGKGIAERIKEYLATGRIKDYEKLKKEVPVDIEKLVAIEGVGPKTVYQLYKKLGIKTLEDLERSCKKGRVQALPGFGKKSEQHILQGIEFLKKSSGRFILGFVMPTVQNILERITKLPAVQRAEPVGSFRRKEETIGDLDLLVVSKNPKAIMDFFVSMPEVIHVYGKGPTKTNVRLNNGMDADLRVVPPESFGAALQYFTGNKYHNIALREIAIQRGCKLNEYGLFKGKKLMAGKTEEEIYEKLGFMFIPPEIRTDSGELVSAREKRLPHLIEYGSLKGDLQVQTNWTDGQHSMKEMVNAAKKARLEYIAMTDHTKSLAMTHGSDEKKILRQMKEIDKIQKEVRGIKILKGAEVNIQKDGTLDIDDSVLAKLDVVGISIHSHFHLSEEEQTKRVIRAMENPHADILFHPTGRVIHRREAIKLDIDAVIKAARRTKTILEINAYPNRLDLKDEYIRKANEGGVHFSIDSDAHNILHFQYLDLGVAQARRGWTEPQNVINTKNWREMLKMLK